MSMIHFRHILLGGCLILLSGTAAPGQGRAHSPEDILQTAVELYKQEQYWSAYNLFRDISSLNTPADRKTVSSYMLLCEIALNDPGVMTRAAQWEKEYPTAPFRQEILLRLGTLQLNKGLNAEAVETYNKIKIKQLPMRYRAEYIFRKGYACLQAGQKKEALVLFGETTKYRGGDQFKTAAMYYRGYIHYSAGDFRSAIPLLEPLRDVPMYAPLASTYFLQSLFYLHEYERVIQEGEKIYATADPALKISLAKILSESYFALNRHREARTFFDDYLTGVRELSRADRYYSGILHFKLGNYSQAAEQLAIAGETTDSLGQNALYHLGEAYIELKNKLGALNAFRSASLMNFDPIIKEDAFFNYAKLSFDTNGDIQALSAYRKEYPDSPKLDEIQTYIAAHSFLIQDYSGAVTALQAITNPTAETGLYLKRAAYLRGIQLYQNGSFREAEKYFSLAEEPYWVAECLYRSDKFSNAISLWKQFTGAGRAYANPERYRTSHYNIAYAYFKQRDYTNAADWFNKFLKFTRNNKKYIADSYLRLGDCAFAQYDHELAASEYRNAIENKTKDADYALYQIAMAEGVLNRDSVKLETLRRLIEEYPSSSFISMALFEQGRTYVRTSQYNNAEEIFRTILAFQEHSAYHAKALVELGLIRINMQQPDQALEFYKEVMQRFPDSPDAANALAGIENVYMAKNDSKGFFDYLNSLGIDSGKTAGEKELLIFSSAEQLYLNNSNASAITALRNFIAEYPKSEKIPAAYFYLGECLAKMDKMQLAADAYLVVMQQPSGSFTELATRNYASIKYALEQYDEAVDAYMSLSDIAVIDNNRQEAQRGLMWSFYKNKQYRNALAQAQKVIISMSLTEKDRTDARYISAKSYLSLGERDKALPLLEELSKDAMTAIGAEAYFLLCKDAFDSGNFDRAEAMIFNLTDTETPQEYWLAHAYILLGDLFAAREEWTQAKATYESVLKEYKPAEPDDIAQLAEHRLKQCEGK